MGSQAPFMATRRERSILLFMSSKEKTMFLCRVALLAAAYFVLSITLTIKTPYLEITFKSLPVVVGALMFGPGGRRPGGLFRRAACPDDRPLWPDAHPPCCGCCPP